MMNDKQREILVITQEECAEVIQSISKIFRFGIDNDHKSGSTQREALEKEIGDLVTMIELLQEHAIVDKDKVTQAIQEKKDKLKIWSNIYK
jgi:NTP pyrophosphatase (non-canonical NTP hydrolase)